MDMLFRRCVLYLHIGNNDMVLVRDVIGVFHLPQLKEGKENKKFLANISKKELEGNKTLVLTEENGLLKPYCTNISSMTIRKRIEKLFYFRMKNEK